MFQILAGRSREVTGANCCHLAASRPPIEFLFWDHCEKAVLGQILAGEVTEVMGGYGRLRAVMEEENGGSGGRAGKSEEKTKEKCGG